MSWTGLITVDADLDRVAEVEFVRFPHVRWLFFALFTFSSL